MSLHERPHSAGETERKRALNQKKETFTRTIHSWGIHPFKNLFKKKAPESWNSLRKLLTSLTGEDESLLKSIHTHRHTLPSWRLKAAVELCRGCQCAAVLQAPLAEPSSNRHVPRVVHCHTAERRGWQSACHSNEHILRPFRTRCHLENSCVQQESSCELPVLTVTLLSCSFRKSWQWRSGRYRMPKLTENKRQQHRYYMTFGIHCCQNNLRIQKIPDTDIAICNITSKCCKVSIKNTRAFKENQSKSVKDFIFLSLIIFQAKTQWKWKREYSVHPAAVSAINMTYGFEYSSRRALNVAISNLSHHREQRQAEAERRTQSPAMQAVMKQATLAAIRALMPQLEMSARLSGAMAAGDAAICEGQKQEMWAKP